MRIPSNLTVLFVIIFHLTTSAQTEIQRDTRADLILKQVAANVPGFKIYNRKDKPAGYVNMAVLDEAKHQLNWFTCYGVRFDTVQLSIDEYKLISGGTVDPFIFYYRYCYGSLTSIEQAQALYRSKGNAALKDSSWNNLQIFNAPPVKLATSSLQKLMAIESLMKKICWQLCLFDSRRPSSLAGTRSDSGRIRKEFAGAMIRKADSTEYYNTDPLAATARIVLRRQFRNKLFIYDREGSMLDSLPLKPGKYASLLVEKEDVFLLYRGWLELQWQQAAAAGQLYLKQLNKQHPDVYNATVVTENNQQILRALDGLQEWQHSINEKVASLIVPDKKYAEQLLANTYERETSEISYLPGLGFAYSRSYIRGRKIYEQTDHRDNVMAVVSDKKKSEDSDGDGIIDRYNADIVSANDYYPFGMQTPGRSYSTTAPYRYGYNGKENDNEVKGDANQLDYGMRIYDPRIGRFLSIDPEFNRFPYHSGYAAFNNSPVLYNDPDGRTGEVTINKQTKTVTVHQRLYLYGSKANQQLATSTATDVQNLYNAANGTVTIGKTTYKVQFEIEGHYLPSDGILGDFKIAAAVVTNKDIRNNYYRVEDQTLQPDGTSFTTGTLAGNTGELNYSQIMAVNSTTEGHEVGHGWGLDHNNSSGYETVIPGEPDIMDQNGDKVLPAYQKSYALPDGYLDPSKRKVTQKNINTIFTPAVLKDLEQKGKANLGELTNTYYEKNGKTLSPDDVKPK